MELLLLLLIAGIGGYFLARSRFSEPIDDAAGKVSDTSRGWVDSAQGWWQGRFGKREQVVDAESYDPTEEETSEESPEESQEEKKPAAKQPSRRKTKSEDEET
jgi:hypothetical protein